MLFFIKITKSTPDISPSRSHQCPPSRWFQGALTNEFSLATKKMGHELLIERHHQQKTHQDHQHQLVHPKKQHLADFCHCFLTHKDLTMDQYLLIPFLGEWTSIYQLFWCSPGVQGFDPSPFRNRVDFVDGHQMSPTHVEKGDVWRVWLVYF